MFTLFFSFFLSHVQMWSFTSKVHLEVRLEVHFEVHFEVPLEVHLEVQ